METKVWARFILSDGATQVFECRNRNSSCRIEISGDAVTRFYDGGPIPQVDCVSAINALRLQEHERFLVWAAKKGIDATAYEYPKPLTLLS